MSVNVFNWKKELFLKKDNNRVKKETSVKTISQIRSFWIIELTVNPETVLKMFNNKSEVVCCLRKSCINQEVFKNDHKLKWDILSHLIIYATNFVFGENSLPKTENDWSRLISILPSKIDLTRIITGQNLPIHCTCQPFINIAQNNDSEENTHNHEA